MPNQGLAISWGVPYIDQPFGKLPNPYVQEIFKKMGILDKLFSFRFAVPAAKSGGPRSYVVDAMGSDRGKERRERMAPGEQVKFLQRLARFTKREALTVSVLLEGKELRAVQQGGDFQGLRVFFEASSGEVETKVVDLVREYRRDGDVTVITDDASLEKSAGGAGAEAMRLSTFVKAWDAATGGGGSSSKPNRNGRRQRSSRRRQQPQQERASVQGGGDTVRDMIDLVE